MYFDISVIFYFLVVLSHGCYNNLLKMNQTSIFVLTQMLAVYLISIFVMSNVNEQKPKVLI